MCRDDSFYVDVMKGSTTLVVAALLLLQEIVVERHTRRRTLASVRQLFLTVLSTSILGLAVFVVTATFAIIRCSNDDEWCLYLLSVELWLVLGLAAIGFRRVFIWKPVVAACHAVERVFPAFPLVLGRWKMHRESPECLHAVVGSTAEIHSVSWQYLPRLVKKAGGGRYVHHTIGGCGAFSRVITPTANDWMGYRALEELLGLSSPSYEEIRVQLAGWTLVSLLCTVRGPEPITYLHGLDLAMDLDKAYKMTSTLSWGRHVPVAQRWLESLFSGLLPNASATATFVIAVLVEKQGVNAMAKKDLLFGWGDLQVLLRKRMQTVSILHHGGGPEMPAYAEPIFNFSTQPGSLGDHPVDKKALEHVGYALQEYIEQYTAT